MTKAKEIASPSDVSERLQTRTGLVLSLLATIVFFVVVSAYYALTQIKSSIKNDIEDTLTTVLTTTHEALDGWVHDQVDDLHYWAERPDISRLIMDQLTRHRNGKSLKSSEALNKLRKAVQPILKDHHDLGFFVISPDYINIGSMRDINIGELNLLAETGNYLNDVFHGQTFITSPMFSDVPLPDRRGNLSWMEPTMFIGAPVYDDKNNVIAALVIRVDPSLDFTRIFKLGRVGKTGETYGFDGQGMLITESRFDGQLRKAGLIKADQRGILSIALRDPGVNLIEGETAVNSKEEQPLTLMANSALTEGKGADLEGYRDYRGAPVVGTWIWDSHFGFGMATEMDLAEAYLPYYTIRRLLLSVLLGTIILFIGFSLVLISNRGEAIILKEKAEQLSEEAIKMNKELAYSNDELQSEIATRIKTEKALNAAKKKAEAASHAKGEFLANMSHEIRTPMTTILGMSELLSESHLDTEQEGYLNGLQKAGDNLIALVNDILDLSKIEAGMIDLEEVEFDLIEELERVTGIFDINAREKGIELTVAIAPEIPGILVGDPLRLRQVLINLVGNGIKFTEKGEMKISVVCEKSHNYCEGDRLIFSVSDTGIGIPSEKLEAIFEDFTQADSSTTRTFGGTGLGLTISKKLVEIMGGKIWVESKMGEGSTFHFNLNMKVGAGKGEAARKKEKPEGKANTAPLHDFAKKINMLVVDDSEDNRLLVKTFLKKSPYNVDMAEDGEIAVQMFSSGKYDIILMDMQMPVMDGYTATAEIRKWEKENGRDETPIIAFTAHALKDEVDKCMEAGCTGHIAKPVKKKEILAVFGKFLGSEGNG